MPLVGGHSHPADKTAGGAVLRVPADQSHGRRGGGEQVED